MFPLASKQLVIPVEQRMRASDHVAEAAQVVFGQHALNRGEDVCNFTATPQDLFIRK